MPCISSMLEIRCKCLFRFRIFFFFDGGGGGQERFIVGPVDRVISYQEVLWIECLCSLHSAIHMLKP